MAWKSRPSWLSGLVLEELLEVDVPEAVELDVPEVAGLAVPVGVEVLPELGVLDVLLRADLSSSRREDCLNRWS